MFGSLRTRPPAPEFALHDKKTSDASEEQKVGAGHPDADGPFIRSLVFFSLLERTIPSSSSQRAGSGHMQVQRQYLTKLLGSLKPHSYGLTFSVLIAVILGVLQAYYGFLTVPHEYGHVWAAQTVGHKVRLVQIDFLDQTEGIQNFFGGVASDTSGFVTGASPPPPHSTSSSSDAQSQSGSSQKVQDYSQDGKLGFVVYEPSMLLVNITSFPNLTAYNSFAGALRPCTHDIVVRITVCCILPRQLGCNCCVDMQRLQNSQVERSCQCSRT